MLFLIYLCFVIFNDRIQPIKSASIPDFSTTMIPQVSQGYFYVSPKMQKDPIEININPTMLRKATINYGSLTYETRLKIVNNECLNIVVIGGSVSCYRTLSVYSDGYADKFEKLLNHHFPCNRTIESERFKQPRHTVVNHCQHAMPTDVFVQKYLESRAIGWDEKGFGADLKESDLIVVETAVNDIHEGAQHGLHFSDPKIYVKKQTELLILLFQNISSHPSLIYLGSSTRTKAPFGCSSATRNGDAVVIHSEITKYYNVPHISLVDGMCPFSDERSIRWFNTYFKADEHSHPSKSGHSLIAALLSSFFFQHVSDLKFPVYGMDAADPTSSTWQLPLPQPLPPLYSTPLEVKANLLSFPWKVDLFKNDIKFLVSSEVVDFAVFEDVHGKPGFIATKTGSSFHLMIPGQNISTHLKMGVITIILMKSFKHMGLMHVTFSIIETKTSAVILSSEKVIDSMWNTTVSELTVETLEYSVATFHEKKLNSNDYSAVFRAEVVSATPARIENKVKLMSVSFS